MCPWQGNLILERAAEMGRVRNVKVKSSDKLSRYSSSNLILPFFLRSHPLEATVASRWQVAGAAQRLALAQDPFSGTESSQAIGVLQHPNCLRRLRPRKRILGQSQTLCCPRDLPTRSNRCFQGVRTKKKRKNQVAAAVSAEFIA